MALLKSKKRLWITLLIVIIAGSGAFVYSKSGVNSDDNQSDPFITAEIGTIVEKALAVGTIQPENEIEVKSKISGVVNIVYAEAGDYVKKGDPLIEVRPDPTPLELAEAKRNLERTENEYDNLLRELQRMQELKSRNLISQQEFDQMQQRYNDVSLRVQINHERLELLESGRITIGNTVIESVIRAPVDGFILERLADVGDPVVPLTSYQAGTPLMTISSMETLLFKGTVDEIDVGKISEGMPVEIKIGALPGVKILGQVKRISLKASQQDNATVFPIEITITDNNGTILRAGYSANADIIIHRRLDVVTVPERVIVMRDNSAFVELPGGINGERIEREVKLGLSDAITVEIKEGLAEGDKVLERPARTLALR